MGNQVKIPNTDIAVYPLGLGTVGAGLDWGGAEADRIFDAFLDLGGNLVDTAHVYSDWMPPEVARSERVVGDWLARSGKRNQIVLMTKGGHPDMTVEEPDTHISRMTKTDMVADLEASLKQLRTDVIDIYFYHRDDESQSVEALVEVMQDFVRAGKIRYYGCSNWSAARMLAADAYCAEKGYRGFVANQAFLNMGMRYMNPMEDDTMAVFDDAMFRYHKENPRNLAMPYMGVCGGFFHLYLTEGEAAVLDSNYYTPGNLRVAEKIRQTIRETGASISQVLLSFFYVQNFPCVPLYGPLTVENLTDAMQTAQLELPYTVLGGA